MEAPRELELAEARKRRKLEDDFSDKRRNHPASPGDRSDAVTIRLEARSRAEVVKQPEGHEGEA